MTAVFADTFFYLALLSRDDAHHAEALAVARRLPGRCITTEFVLAELLDGFANMPGRARAAEWVRRLRSDPNVEVVSAGESLFEKAFLLYASRADKQWSLTDCASFVVMRERRLSDALTHDHHFEQAGFGILL